MEKIYDCIVVGAGPSAEPVLHHLSKTDLNVLIIFADMDYVEAANKKQLWFFGKFLDFFSISPKQFLGRLLRVTSNVSFSLGTKYRLSADNYSYSFTFGLGGLSEFWSGGAIRWNKHEIELASGLPFTKVETAYCELENRLGLVTLNQYRNCAISQSLLSGARQKLNFRRPLFFCSRIAKITSRLKGDFDQQFVWSARTHFEELYANYPNFTFDSSFVADISRCADGWSVNCIQKNYTTSLKSKFLFLCAGAVGSAGLVYKALRNQGLICDDPYAVPLWSNSTVCVPVQGPKYCLGEYSPQLPEFHWDLHGEQSFPLASGYVFTTQFLLKTIIPPVILNCCRLALRFFLSRIYIFTVFSKASLPESVVYFSSSHAQYLNVRIRSRLVGTTAACSVRSILKSLQSNLPSEFHLLPFFALKGKRGSAIHYASTIPYRSKVNSPENKNLMITDSYGRVPSLKGLFVCDASRLAYLSSKPHTLTSMALTEASMPVLLSEIENNY